MSLWTALEPASATVDPGATATVRLRVRNTGDIVDEYRIEPVGDMSPWIMADPQILRLYPGTTGTVELTFAPPRTPDATAGPNPYAVRVVPTEVPDAVMVPEGVLTITPFTEMRAELVPPIVKGRFRGRPKLAVDNLGNTELTTSIRGNDSNDNLTYELRPANVQIAPGRAAFVKATLRPRRIIWLGPSQQLPYAIDLTRSGDKPFRVDGKYQQRGFLPRWIATVLVLFAALAVAFVAFWLAHKPSVTSAATEKVNQVVSTLTPTPAPTTPTTTPPTSATPSTQPSSGGGGGGGGGKRKPKGLLPASNVLLRNTTTARCADLPDSGPGQLSGPVNEFKCTPKGDNQLWDLQVRYDNLGPGGTQLFQIRNVTDQLCMDLPGGGPADIRSHIDEYTCDGTTQDNQLWWLAKQRDGYYWIRNYASRNLCLDVSGFSTGVDNTPLTIYTCSDTDDQEWQIQPQKQDQSGGQSDDQSGDQGTAD